MTGSQTPVRTYGGWRRSRSIGLLGPGPAATLVMLGCFAALILVAAFSLQAFVYVAPPTVLAGAVSVIRAGGVPLAQLAVQRLRWWRGTRAGHTTYRAEVVRRHTGVLQLPGTLAATELLSAEDGAGGRYGLVRDRHTGYLTATLRVAPVSTWLADPGDADRWVANWGAWLASLGVAVQTLYFTFHTKAQLLQQTLDRVVLGDGPPVPPPQTPWYKAMQAQEAIRPALEHLVVGVTQIMERVAPLRPVFEAAAAEPGVAEVWLNAERLRLEGYRAIIELLATKQPLAAGHTADSATDIMFVLLGPDTFRAFINGRGWLLEQWKAWVTTTLERDLFSQPAPRSS